MVSRMVLRTQVVFAGVFLLTQSNANKQPSYQKMEEKASAELGQLDGLGTGADKPGPAGTGAAEIGRTESESKLLTPRASQHRCVGDGRRFSQKPGRMQTLPSRAASCALSALGSGMLTAAVQSSSLCWM